MRCGCGAHACSRGYPNHFSGPLHSALHVIHITIFRAEDHAAWRENLRTYRWVRKTKQFAETALKKTRPPKRVMELSRGGSAMKTKILTGSLLAVALLAIGFWAVPQRLSANQTQQDQSNQGMMGQGQGQGMMNQGQGMTGGGMNGMMGQMTTHHQEMTTLMNKLMESMKAIQTEKDPAALKSKLAEHQALLEQMRGHMMQQGKMMQMMPGQVKQSCPGASEPAKPTPGG
jgi:hypothetical protein